MTDPGPPPLSRKGLLLLGGLLLGVLGICMMVVLPVARKLQGEQEQQRGRARRVARGLPGSEPIWGVKLDAERRPDGRLFNRADGTELLPVPAGRFRMGRDGGPRRSAPAHAVDLSRYWIARFTVTRAQYARFLASAAARAHTACHPLEPPRKSHAPAVAGGDPELPITGVDWFDAYAYVAWAGLRLPTEAEWERAAGGADGRPYPWGAGPPDARRAWFGRSGPIPCGALPESDSPVGARQMAGNVWEWCYDRFDAGCYARSLRRDPRGPAGGDDRVVRGGSWLAGPEALDVCYRHWRDPLARAPDLGFRCAR